MLGRPTLFHSDPKTGIALVLAAAIVFPTGCSIGPSVTEVEDGPPNQALNVAMVPDAVPRVEPHSKYGNPTSYVVNGKRYYTLRSSEGYEAQGVASWYGTKFHGQRTSSGEAYDMYAMTAAHKTLPLPTYARITNLRNGRGVVVKINDRGPFHANRLIDLSYVAASKLGILKEGTGLVRVQALNPHNLDMPPRTLSAERLSKPSMYIQVGAFDSQYNADRLRSRLRSAFTDGVRIQQAGAANRLVYRVQIGPVGTIERVDALTLKLTQLGIKDVHLIVD